MDNETETYNHLPPTSIVRDAYTVAKYGVADQSEKETHGILDRFDAEFDRWLASEKAEGLRAVADEFRATEHAWGKLAMVQHLLSTANRIEGRR